MAIPCASLLNSTANDLVVKAAVDLWREDGNKLRGDTTVVQTDIHHPTDNTLLWDAVRVVTRTVGRLADAIGRRIEGFHNGTRAARRRMQKNPALDVERPQESTNR